jgi:hypothetical protein
MNIHARRQSCIVDLPKSRSIARANAYALDVAAGNSYFGGNITATGPVKTGGYTVSTLPAGTVGMRSYVTDQTYGLPFARRLLNW